jgi:hypothetical protein
MEAAVLAFKDRCSPIRMSKGIERTYNRKMSFEDAQHLSRNAVEE